MNKLLTCNCEDSTGNTTVRCCNLCGLSVDHVWKPQLTFEKFTLLKETPTAATDNTLPPSSPTGETAPKMSMTFFLEKYQVFDTNHEGFIRTDLALIAMQEYAIQERQEAHNRAVQECIDLVEGISIQGWVTDSKPFEKIIKQLEKLKK